MYVFTRAEASDEFNIYSIADAFDPERISLWRTQSEALEFLYGCGEKSIRAKELRSRYVKCARCFPELYEGVAFEAWLRFLQAEQLITRDKHLVALTPLGVDLVEGFAADGRTNATQAHLTALLDSAKRRSRRHSDDISSFTRMSRRGAGTS
jgi:hypothetical protein